MDSIIGAFLILVLVFSSFMLGFAINETPDEDWRKLKTQCEQDLPRSQECVMTYVRGKE